MSGQKRTACFLFILIVGLVFIGCTTSPTVTPEVIETQTELNDATDTLGDAIQDASEQAQEIASVTVDTEYAELTKAHAEKVRDLVTIHNTLKEKVTAANELSLKLAGDNEKLRTENLEQETEIAILKGQRLALLLILGFLFTLFLLYLYARIKRLV